MTQVQLQAGRAGLTVSARNGGRWSSLRVGDLELLGRGGDTLVDWGCYPMAPYAGRVRRGVLRWAGRAHQLHLAMPPHAIHGVCLDRPWQLLDAGPATATLRCDFDSRWPWAGHAVQHLELTDTHLDARLEVHADDVAMPAWTGWHPWLRRRLARGEPARIEVDCEGILPRDDDGMPRPDAVAVPEGPWDDCFTGVRWPARVVWDGALALSISSDAAFAVVFDHKPDAVCVEPQTAPPNAVELGMAGTAEPGAPVRLTTRFSWQ